ncbi:MULTISPECIES: non-heme iron oxygenase ferredoxin subunit [unclassified Geodermatophilus]|uniref:non-heme iron oxygenase ferredoxin subunit n=1 Tax=unclassified Geodermatophilus TaxID=2637632 RepID=UPI003EEFCF8F
MQEPLCRSDEVAPGTVISVDRGNSTPIAVCNVDGTFYAVDDLCSHGASSLSEGQLIGCEIECVLHKGRFDVTTGKATRRPAKKPVATYGCTVQDGFVYLADPVPDEQDDSLLQACAS